MATCVRCGRELPSFSIGELSDTCRECQQQVQTGTMVSQEETEAARPKSLYALTPATTAIIAINAIVLVAMTVAEGMEALTNPSTEILIRWGGDWGVQTLSHQPWRMFTSMWLHVGIVHLALNMWCLNIYGRVTERLFGWRFYLLMYVFAGVCGSLASLAWSPNRVSAGASGAIFGVAGALVMPYRLGALAADAAVLKKASKSLLGFIGYNLFIGLVVPMIDNSAHVGGLLGGFAMGLLWTRYRPMLGSRLARIALVCSVFIGAALVTARYARHWDVLVNEANQALIAGRYDEAMAKAKALIAHNPADANGYDLLGSAYVAKDQPKEAAEALEHAVRIDPKDEFALRRLGAAYIKLGRLIDAKMVLEQAVELNDQDAYAFSDLGLVYWKLRRESEAMTKLNRAIELEPNEAQAHYVLGMIYQTQQQEDRALQSFERAVNASPDEKEYAEQLAWAYETRGRKADADKVRSKAGLLK